MEPIHAKNIDISVEWYYGEESYLSLGIFDKDVDKFIGSGIEEDTLFNIPNIIGGALWNQAISEGGLDPQDYTTVGQYIQIIIKIVPMLMVIQSRELPETQI